MGRLRVYTPDRIARAFRQVPEPIAGLSGASPGFPGEALDHHEVALVVEPQENVTLGEDRVIDLEDDLVDDLTLVLDEDHDKPSVVDPVDDPDCGVGGIS